VPEVLRNDKRSWNSKEVKVTKFVAITSIPFYELLERAKKFKIELKSLILAQIERWRHALHMQVER
jgi:hypothetical protein